MEWLAAVGALANPIATIVDDLSGAGAAKANAAKAAAEAQAAQYQAQVQAAQIAAQNQQQMMLYALGGIGVLVVGAIAYKALA